MHVDEHEHPKKLKLDYIKGYITPALRSNVEVNVLCELAVRPLADGNRGAAVATLIDLFMQSYGEELARRTAELTAFYRATFLVDAGFPTSMNAGTRTFIYTNRLLSAMVDNCADAFVDHLVDLARRAFTDEAIHDKVFYQRSDTFTLPIANRFRKFAEDAIYINERGL